MRFGIAEKISLLVVSILLALGTVLAGYFVVKQREILTGALSQRAQVLVSNLAANLQYPVLVADQAAIDRLVGSVLSQSDVAACRVVSGDRKHIAFAGDSTHPGVSSFAAAVTVERPPQGAEELLLGGESMPVEVIATVHLDVRSEGLTAQIAAVQKTVFGFMVVAILCAAITCFVLVKYVLGGPIARLAEATRSIARGELEVMVSIESNDEMGDLANAFNAMAAELQSTLVTREYVDKIIDSMVDAVIVADTGDIITRVNAAACNLLDYEASGMVGQPLSVLFGSGQSPHRVTGTDTRRFLVNTEQVLQTRSGLPVPVMFSSSAMKTADGEIEAIVNIAADIRELKKAEAEIRKLSSAVEQSTEGIALADLEGRITYVNNAFARMHGHDPTQMDGLSLATTFPPGDERFLHMFSSIAESGAWAGEMLSMTHDELTFPTYVSATVLRDDGGKPMAVLVHVSDVSHQKELESQLAQAQKLESIGQLAGGVAHDFNNMLGAISGYADMIHQRFGADNPTLDKYAGRISEAAMRSADLTAKLLAFARKAATDFALVDMHVVIQDVVTLLEHTIDRRIRIVRNLTATTPTVMGDRSLLQNAVLNLAVNARDAMPQGGEMMLSTGVVTAEQVPWHGRTSARPVGTFLRVSVTDTGTGMDEHTLARMFEPFFTTKQIGKGTGLGLASVYGTVQSHKGMVDVHSEQGKGSRFDMYLPHADTPLAGHKDAQQKIEKGKGTILLVDDEDLVRDMARDMLQHIGYTVVPVEDGAEAIEYYQAHSSEIDLVILDMIMPRVGGYDCFIALQRINPGVRVVISSGYALNDDVRKAMEAGARGFVQKPFEMKSLAKTVRDAITGQESKAV